MRCKCTTGMNFIKINFIPGTAGIPNWNRLFCWEILSSCLVLAFFFDFLFLFFPPLLPPLFPQVVPLGRFAPVTQPRGRRTLWCSSRRGVSRFWGPLALVTTFARGKAALPRAGNPPRVEQVVLFQVDRKHHQEFRAVLFPFSRRGLAPVLPKSASGFPLPEKNPKTRGVPAGNARLCSAGDESWPCWSLKTSSIDPKVIL